MSSPTIEAEGHAMAASPAQSSTRMRTWLLFLLIVFSCALLDVATKDWAFEMVPSPYSEPVAVIDGFFYIVHATNTGAMWSLFQDVQSEFWIAIRGGVFLILLTLVLRSMPKPRWARLGFALVLAGALGNLHDNLFCEGGAVRDWLRFDFWGWPFPIFNVADSCICVGAPLLLIYFYRLDQKPKVSRE